MQLWSVRSCSFFGGDRLAKYDGAPTAAICMSGQNCISPSDRVILFYIAVVK